MAGASSAADPAGPANSARPGDAHAATAASTAGSAAVPTAQPADASEDDDALWRGIDLEFGKEGAKAEDEPADVELEEQKDEEST